MAILVLPSAMAIMAIWPFLAVMAHMAMADSKTNMAIRVNHGGVQNAIRKITPSYLALYNP